MKVNVKVVATQHSFHFFDRTSIPCQIYEDKDEWQVCTLLVIKSSQRGGEIYALGPGPMDASLEQGQTLDYVSLDLKCNRMISTPT